MNGKKSDVEQKLTEEPLSLVSAFERATTQQKNDFEQGLQSTKSMIDNILSPVNKNKDRFESIKQNFAGLLNKS